MTHRVAVLDKELCQPKKCGLECIKYCPVNKSGADCIVLNEDTNKATIDEDICKDFRDRWKEFLSLNTNIFI